MAWRLDSMRIPREMLLTVDDDTEAAASCAKFLQLEGDDVVTACTDEGDWRAIATSHPNAIVLDFPMPLVDNAIFVRCLRSHQYVRLTPIAIITTDYFADDELDVELDALNAVVCFNPLWFADLLLITERLFCAGLHDARVTTPPATNRS